MFPMKLLFTSLVAGSLLVFGSAAWSGKAAAQTDLEPFESMGTDDDGANILGDSADPFDLIHRAILAPSMSAEEFFEQQNRVLGTEAQNFRLRQQELLRQQAEPTMEDTEEITVDEEEL